jgi:hypothetical protein
MYPFGDIFQSCESISCKLKSSNLQIMCDKEDARLLEDMQCAQNTPHATPVWLQDTSGQLLQATPGLLIQATPGPLLNETEIIYLEDSSVSVVCIQ